MEISSKLDSLKRQKIECEQAKLAKKQATWRLSEVCTEYDDHKERIRAITKELDKDKVKLTSLVNQGEAVKAKRLEHLQRAESLGQFLASQRNETMSLASKL